MHAQRLHVGFDLEPLYTGLYNPRWPHMPEEYKLEMSVEVERLKLETLLPESLPQPQDNLLPRLSHAAGTGLDEPVVSHAETQKKEQEETFPLQPSVDGFLRINCTSLEQERTISLQEDIGVNDETTTTTAQAAAREEFARPPKNRQQRRVTAWGVEQTKQFDPGGGLSIHSFPDGCLFRVLFAPCVFVFLFSSSLQNSCLYQGGTRGEKNFPSSVEADHPGSSFGPKGAVALRCSLF